MFIKIANFTTNKTDLSGRELLKTTRTIYMFDNQEITDAVLNEETQAYYKKLFTIQEEASKEASRPVSIFEALKIGI